MNPPSPGESGNRGLLRGHSWPWDFTHLPRIRGRGSHSCFLTLLSSPFPAYKRSSTQPKIILVTDFLALVFPYRMQRSLLALPFHSRVSLLGLIHMRPRGSAFLKSFKEPSVMQALRPPAQPHLQSFQISSQQDEKHSFQPPDWIRKASYSGSAVQLGNYQSPPTRGWIWISKDLNLFYLNGTRITQTAPFNIGWI